VEDGMVKSFLELYGEAKDESLLGQMTWQILVAKAMNRQTMTYGILDTYLGTRRKPAVRNRALVHIMFFCKQNELPPLTILVVSPQRGGIPGPGLTTVDDPDADRESVYEYDWVDLIPPTAKELRTAWKEAHGHDE